MPQSATSSSGKQSGSSAITRRYRTRALTSHVDESLFGTPKQHSAADMKDDPEGRSVRSRKLSYSAPAPREPKSETVRIITKDLIRDLRIPNEDPSGQSVILSSGEFQRIMEESYVPSQEEKAAVLEAQRQAREEAMLRENRILGGLEVGHVLNAQKWGCIVLNIIHFYSHCLDLQNFHSLLVLPGPCAHLFTLPGKHIYLPESLHLFD
ncbi:hypothetical protein QQF64_012196 [Cirrhinus molitorella]|uniref:Uncharacterized protein n=1 Tax=Cirrhinus molitorella TaxID=172907 RepID=A0ABR3LX56_9TELE